MTLITSIVVFQYKTLQKNAMVQQAKQSMHEVSMSVATVMEMTSMSNGKHYFTPETFFNDYHVKIPLCPFNPEGKWLIYNDDGNYYVYPIDSKGSYIKENGSILKEYVNGDYRYAIFAWMVAHHTISHSPIPNTNYEPTKFLSSNLVRNFDFGKGLDFWNIPDNCDIRMLNVSDVEVSGGDKPPASICVFPRAKSGDYSYVYQNIRISGKAGDTYYIGGWIKYELSNNSNNYRCIDICIHGTDGHNYYYCTDSSKVSNDGRWHEVSRIVEAPKDYNEITIYALGWGDITDIKCYLLQGGR